MSVRAVTIWQPFAHAIAHGTKRIENRGWATKYRGPLLIHAGAPTSKSKMTDFLAYCRERRLDPAYDGGLVPGGRQPVYRAVVALATLRRCGRDLDAVPPFAARWANPGQFGWVLGDVVALDEPVPCIGRQGLWIPPADVVEAVLKQAPARYMEVDNG